MKISIKSLLAVALMTVMSQLATANVYDVNCDGSVTANDVTAIYNYMLSGDMTYYATSDVNGDGHITSTDVTILYEVLLNGIPVPERLVGGDISMITKYEQNGAIYKDRNGNTIITRLDEQMLQKIAAAGNGIYVRASNSNVGLEKIYGDINKLDKSEIDAKVFTDYEDQFQWFVAAAIMFLLIEIFVSSGKKGWERKFNIFEKKDE